MPLPKIEYHTEEVVVGSVEYGPDDRGILTCTLFCEWGACGQGFGNLILDGRTGPAFVRDLCAVFGVEAPKQPGWLRAPPRSCWTATRRSGTGRNNRIG